MNEARSDLPDTSAELDSAAAGCRLASSLPPAAILAALTSAPIDISSCDRESIHMPRHMPRQTGSARVRLQAIQHEREIVFSIAGNGVGFDQQYARKLFRAFQRLHRTGGV